MPGPSPQRVLTSITHTINVVEPTTGSYFSSSSQRCVTKYVVRVTLVDALEWQVARRYSHFHSNHVTLSSMFPGLRLPKLPPKTLRMGNTPFAPPDPETVASRMVLLDTYLKQLLSNPAIACCTQMRTFLGAYQGMQPTWFADVSASRIDDDIPSDGPIDAFAALTFGPMSSTSSAAAPPLPPPTLPPPPRPARTSSASGARPSAADPPPLEVNLPYRRADALTASGLIEHLGLPTSVDAFARNFGALRFAEAPDAAAAMAHRFLNCMEAAIAVAAPASLVHHYALEGVLWSARDQSPRSGSNPGQAAWCCWSRPPNITELPTCHAGQAHWSCARPLAHVGRLEDRLMGALATSTCGVLKEEILRDGQLARRLSALGGVLKAPEQLDIPPAFCDVRFNRWDGAALTHCPPAHCMHHPPTVWRCVCAAGGTPPPLSCARLATCTRREP
jgi:hypothetical protein